MDDKKLALKYAMNSNKRRLAGIEVDDLFQCAMIGIHKARQNHQESKGSLESYAHAYIVGEIHNMIYKTVTIDGEQETIPRMQEGFHEEIQETYVQDYVSEIWVDDFLEGIPLDGIEHTFFCHLLNLGEREATRIYMEATGVSRARASQVKRKIIKVAQDYHRGLE